MSWRMKACLGGILFLLFFLGVEAQAAVAGAPRYYRPAPPRDPNGPTGWLCQDKPVYMDCHYIYAPDSCFEWAKKPDVRGFCTFVDGYEEDWLREWKESNFGMGWSAAPRISAGPEIGTPGTYRTLDVLVSPDPDCLPETDGCDTVAMGRAACGTETQLIDGTTTTSISDSRFYLVTPRGEAAPPVAVP